MILIKKYVSRPVKGDGHGSLPVRPRCGEPLRRYPRPRKPRHEKLSPLERTRKAATAFAPLANYLSYAVSSALSIAHRPDVGVAQGSLSSPAVLPSRRRAPCIVGITLRGNVTKGIFPSCGAERTCAAGKAAGPNRGPCATSSSSLNALWEQGAGPSANHGAVKSRGGTRDARTSALPRWSALTQGAYN